MFGKYRLLIACLFLSAGISAQDVKIEKEHRVDIDQVPPLAVEWLSTTYPNITKVKWYLEESSRKGDSLYESNKMVLSYEAKFKKQGALVSVEFSETGVVEDVETVKSLEELNEITKEKLLENFQEIPKFKLVKLQEQYSSDNPESVQQALIENIFDKVTIRYEIEFKAKIDGKHATWEGLFDKNGQLISKRKIILRPTDNLDL